jgi:hypothetical protein
MGSDYELLTDAPSAADCTALPVTAQELQLVQTARHVDNLVSHWPAEQTVRAPYSTPERPAETTEFGSSARRGPLSRMPFTGSLMGIIDHRQSEPLKDRNPQEDMLSTLPAADSVGAGSPTNFQGAAKPFDDLPGAPEANTAHDSRGSAPPQQQRFNMLLFRHLQTALRQPQGLMALRRCPSRRLPH